MAERSSRRGEETAVTSASEESKEPSTASVEEETPATVSANQFKAELRKAVTAMSEAVKSAHQAALNLENSDLLAQVLDHLGKAEAGMQQLLTDMEALPC